MDPSQGYLTASRGYLKKTIGQHPTTTAAIMAVLVVVVLILAYSLVHFKSKCAKGGSEGLAVGGKAAAACAPGETAVTYQNPDGSIVTYCRATDSMPGPATVCKAGWDPAASAEAEALATVGSLQHDSYGEGKLQRAINAAYDSSAGMSDAQLEAVMHQGGTP
jgi:hypothetical protein